ncbi:polymer-forming cytoskeletal protein [Halomonas sp. SpR1]|uniref:bactofilin family protein n=1 Tax=Halomonas sp. SpR1 TaxID=3050462 RepID=UPI0027E44640|nr:polymer-forming cytoskeletal protein [Halomonas sp. SpR1]MDQ7735499.1 polymer-forming cytoskeletal protein [Halomonas sp. SpR1]
MFNKAKSAPPENKAATLAPPDTRSSAAPSTATSSSRPSLSVIGGHTQVEGDINSDEDLTVEGRVSGIITCKQHTVTLGANGYINGDVFAHTLHVSGEVIGNLVVLHRATIHKGAQVSGTIVAPCLVLEDGSVFHGSIDMDPDNEMLKRAFSDATGHATNTSAINSGAMANSHKATVDKHATASANAPEHEETEAKAND